MIGIGESAALDRGEYGGLSVNLCKFSGLGFWRCEATPKPTDSRGLCGRDEQKPVPETEVFGVLEVPGWAGRSIDRNHVGRVAQNMCDCYEHGSCRRTVFQ